MDIDNKAQQEKIAELERKNKIRLELTRKFWAEHKKLKYQDEENIVWLDGADLGASEIFRWYYDMIFYKGYKTSIEDICEYLCCSYMYFLKNFVTSAKHIRITKSTRDIMKYFIYNETEEVSPLIYKRILYNKGSFYEYLNKEIIVEHRFKTFYSEDFDRVMDNKEQIYDLIEDWNKSRWNKNHRVKGSKRLEDFLKQVSLQYQNDEDDREGVLEPLPEGYIMPDKFYGIDDLRRELDHNFNAQTYRVVEKYGLNKYHLGNLVRFDIREVQRGIPINIGYRKYLEMRQSGKTDDNIIRLLINGVLVKLVHDLEKE